MPVYVTHNEAETDALAGRVARAMPPGTVLALHGPMGAGKTRFVRGLVSALGGDARAVSSPTFVLLHLYPTPGGTLHHLDAYRVRSEADFESIGFEELLDQPGWVCVEWPERVAGLLPPAPRTWRVEIRPGVDAAAGGSVREFVLPVLLPD